MKKAIAILGIVISIWLTFRVLRQFELARSATEIRQLVARRAEFKTVTVHELAGTLFLRGSLASEADLYTLLVEIDRINDSRIFFRPRVHCDPHIVPVKDEDNGLEEKLSRTN